MAAKSVEDYVEDLITRQATEERTRGAPAPEVEAATLFETIAISFLLNPRAALYTAFLARNLLLVSAQEELAAIDELTAVISDLGNTTVAITNTRSLENAKTALIQMESQGRIDATGSSFKRFSGAIDSFLEKQLAKNVRRPGSTTMTRPSSEALTDLAPAYENLKTAHSSMLTRLYALSVGIPNFLNTPLSTIIGLGASSRARRSIEGVISSLENDPSGTGSRDVAAQLVANRATLRLLGTAPSIATPVLDTISELPAGYKLQAVSEEEAPVAVSTIGPWVLPAAASLTAQVKGDLIVAPLFPQTTIDQRNAAILVGTAISLPLSIDPEESLFLTITASAAMTSTFTLQSDGSYLSSDALLGAGWSLTDGVFSKTIRANLNSSASTVSMFMADVLFAIDASLSPLIQAFEYVQPGTGRIYLWSDPVRVASMMVSPTHVAPSASTLGIPSVYTLSANAKLGLYVGQIDSAGSTSRVQIEEAFDLLFGAIASMRRIADGTMTVTALDAAPLTIMTLGGSVAEALGIDGLFGAQSRSFHLFGTVLGEEMDPVSPIDIIEVGDIVSTTTGHGTVTAVSDTTVILDSALPSFSGDITVQSGLYLAWAKFDVAMKAFVDDWVTGPFASDLTRIDRVLAPLAGDATQAQRNTALNILATLRTQIVSLIDALSSSQIVAGGARKEKKIIDGISQSLLERKYDRAFDLLTRCQLQEMFTLDWQSASFAGSVMQAASNVARTDLRFPNRAAGEGSDIKASVSRSETPL